MIVHTEMCLRLDSSLEADSGVLPQSMQRACLHPQCLFVRITSQLETATYRQNGIISWMIQHRLAILSNSQWKAPHLFFLKRVSENVDQLSGSFSRWKQPATLFMSLTRFNGDGGTFFQRLMCWQMIEMDISRGESCTRSRCWSALRSRSIHSLIYRSVSLCWEGMNRNVSPDDVCPTEPQNLLTNNARGVLPNINYIPRFFLLSLLQKRFPVHSDNVRRRSQLSLL